MLATICCKYFFKRLIQYFYSLWRVRQLLSTIKLGLLYVFIVRRSLLLDCIQMGGEGNAVVVFGFISPLNLLYNW